MIGPKGDTGDDGEDGLDFNGTLPKATTESPGIVQVGKGLDITDDTAILSVDFSDVELVGGITKTFEPIYIDDISDNTVETVIVDSRPNLFKNYQANFPTTANRAMIWWFNPTQLQDTRKRFLVLN